MTTTKQAGSILPFSFDNIPVRGKAISLKNLEEFIPCLKNNDNFVQELVKQSLTAVVLFQQDLKADQSLTLQIVSNSSIKLVIAQALADGTIKAYADVEKNNKIDNFADFAKTEPKIVITVDNKGKAYKSIIPVAKNSLKDCIIEYYEQSVQTKTFINFLEHNQVMHAIMLQHLATEELTKDDWERICLMAESLKAEETELTNTQIVSRLFAEDTIRVYEESNLAFYTGTDKKRMENAIKSLGILQCHNLLKDGDIEMTDQFSGVTETFTHEDIKRIFNEVKDGLIERNKDK